MDRPALKSSQICQDRKLFENSISQLARFGHVLSVKRLPHTCALQVWKPNMDIENPPNLTLFPEMVIGITT